VVAAICGGGRGERIVGIAAVAVELLASAEASSDGTWERVAEEGACGELHCLLETMA
jgi:hypothetical protein